MIFTPDGTPVGVALTLALLAGAEKRKHHRIGPNRSLRAVRFTFPDYPKPVERDGKPVLTKERQMVLCYRGFDRRVALALRRNYQGHRKVTLPKDRRHPAEMQQAA